MKKIPIIAIVLVFLMTNCKKDPVYKKVDIYTGEGEMTLNGREEKIKVYAEMTDSTQMITLFFDVISGGVASERIIPKTKIPLETKLIPICAHYYKNLCGDGDAVCDVYISDSSATSLGKNFIDVTNIDAKKREIKGNFGFIFLKQHSCQPNAPDTIRAVCDKFLVNY